MTRSGTHRLRDRLLAAAARRFVGRETELSVMRDLLVSDVPAWPVLLVHGPGGVGKTTLLERLRGVAAELGVDSLRLDGREVDPSPEGFVRAVGSALALDDEACTLDRVCEALGRSTRRLFIVDTFEQLQPLEGWLREAFLPACPDGMLTVLAGRVTPQREWLSDPLWQGHAHVMALRNLPEAACVTYVQAQELDEELGRQVIALSHGHPLALSLLSDIARSNGSLPAALAADVIRDLAERFSAVSPSATHRHALELSAMLRRTTEESLASVLGEHEAPSLFDWLSSLNFVERSHDGLFPHDLVRQAVLDEFFAREPERYRTVRRALGQRLLVRMLDTPPASAWPLVCDYNFLHRHRSPIEHYHEYRTMGSAHFRPAVPTDAGAIEALVAAEALPEEAAQLRRWLVHPAAITWVAGSAPSRVDGIQVTIDVGRIDREMLSLDPYVEALVAALDRVVPAIPGRGRYITRYHVKRGGMFALKGGVANAIQMSEWYQWVTTPGLLASCLVVPHPEHWQDMMQYFGFAPLVGGSMVVGGIPHGSFYRESREKSPRDTVRQQLGEQRGDRGLRRLEPRPGAPAPGGDACLSRDIFVQAVREALRHMTRDSRLANSPLLATRLVQRSQRPNERPSAALRRLLVEVAQEQRQTPRHERFWRALDLTYFRPAGTQEAVAARLGLPFNTYRYRLSTAVERLIDRLWELESAASE